jgi:hypothetical protein
VTHSDIPVLLQTNEDVRVQAVRALEALDTTPDAELDALVEASSYVWAKPISSISLNYSDRQWIKVKMGLDASQTPRIRLFAVTQYYRTIFSKCSTC